MAKRKSSMPKPINPKDFLSKKFLEKEKELQDQFRKQMQENAEGDYSISHELRLTMQAYHALKQYKINPEYFNIYPEGIEIDDARMLLKFFCYCVNNDQEVPKELNEYLRDAFEKILEGNLTYDRCLNLVGRKEKHPYHPPEYLKEITEDILNKGITLSESCKEKQIKTGKNYKTLMQYFGEYSETLLYGWFFYQEMKGKKITYKHLKAYQKKAIKKYFLDQVHENYK